ncbi:unnamed protein product [Triticum turgidum subsp. durum]|uniref:K Homology domain-containing protein n=1 Tax=Triticum turgidum subsp. durum TaxID=4567 RepID=A0A9R0QQT6_TRITD|nr:unnamed protein product [Triticum turgidum subsp. durum]
MLQCLVGMTEMQRNSAERWVTQMVRKSQKEALGTVTGQDSTDDVGPGGDTTCSAGENRYPDWPGTTVFRMLISATKLGPIIGYKGERVRRLCEETKACIRIIGGHLAGAERAVIIFAKEQPDELIPPAMDALLRVYQHIIYDDGLNMGSDSTVVARILIPSEQAVSLIGEQGLMIYSIEEASKTNIYVLDCDLPPVAIEEDRIVEIWGQPARVRKALELVASHLRKYLVDRSVIPLFDPHVPLSMLHVEMPQCHYSDHPEGMPLLYYSDHPEGRLEAVSPLCHSDDHQREPQWTETYYTRCRNPVEAPTSFGIYRSVTPPHHCISVYGQETSSPPKGTYLSAPIELGSHHNLTSYELRATSPIGASATVERIRSLISVHGHQAHPLRKTCQSATMGKRPHLGISLYGSESHTSRVSPSAAADLPTPCGMCEYELQASQSLRMYPPATVENLLHCRVSACGPEAPSHVLVRPLTSKSPAITAQVTEKMQVPIIYAEAVIGPTGARIDYIRRASRSSILINDLEEDAMSIEINGSSATDVQTAEQLIKNFMAEAAAASPGHKFDSIPSYLPAPRSPQPDILRTSYIEKESGVAEQRLQTIY